MTTEDWKPRYNDGQNEDGQNRERRPYNADRSNYGRQQDNRSFNRPRTTGSYDRREGGNYNRPKPSYGNNYEGGGYNNRNYNRSEGNYERPQRSYDNSQRSYDNSSNDSQDSGIKKRRPRVGEPISTRSSYSNRPTSGGYNNSGGYNRGSNNSYSQGGGMQQRRPQQQGNWNDRKGYNTNSTFNAQKQQKYREENFDPNELLRLNKYLANAGVCSRREADEFIQAGLVKVNGTVVTELGTKVKRSDEVVFHNEPVKLEHKIYLLLNKPKNCVTTADDPQERLTVMDLVKTACQERIFPVGRLDRNTTGVILLTNDGDLSSKLTHPKFLKKKIYHVWLDKDVSVADMQKLADGIELEDGEIHADAISYVTDEAKDQVGIEIHSGRNRIVRRMFESLGYHVIKLDRVYFAGLTKKNLKRGQWRFLSEKEVSMLRMGAFE